MLCVALTVYLQGDSKLFRYIMIHEEKSFSVHLDGITLHQT